MCVREHARMRAARACQCARPHARDTYAAGADEPRARTTSAVDTNRMLPGHGGRAHAEHATPGAQRSAAAATRTHVPRQPVATRSAASRTRIVCTSAAFLLRYGHDGHANPFVVHQQVDHFFLKKKDKLPFRQTPWPAEGGTAAAGGDTCQRLRWLPSWLRLG